MWRVILSKIIKGLFVYLPSSPKFSLIPLPKTYT